MKRRTLTAAAVLAIVVSAAYLATSQPIGPVGIRYVQTDSSLTGSGVTANTLKVNTANVQARVTGTCTSPNAIRVVNSDGTVTCTTGVIDTAGSGLSSSGSTIYANMGGASCANGSAVTAISGSGVGTCTVVNTLTGVGDITGVTAGSGLSGGGTSGAVTVAVGAGSGILAAGAVTSTNIGAGLTYSSGAIVPNLAGASCGAGSAVSAISSAGTGTCTGLISGTSGRSTRFSSTTAIGNGGWTDDGTNVTSVGTVSTVSTTTLGDDKGDVITFNNGPIGVNRYAGIHKEWAEEMIGYVGGSDLSTIGGIGLAWSWSGSHVYITNNGATGRFGLWQLGLGAAGIAGDYQRLFSNPAMVDDGSTTIINGYLTSTFGTLSSTSNSAATMYVARWGFTSVGAKSAASSDVTTGVYLMYDRGNTATGNKNASNVNAWSCWSANGGTRTGYLINNTGNSDESFALGVGSISAGTYSRWRIKITTTAGTPTRAEFYTVAQDDVETKVCDINTNLPSTLTQLGFMLEFLPKATTGTGDANWNLDQLLLSFDAAASRNP